MLLFEFYFICFFFLTMITKHNFVFRADNRPANAGLGQTKPEGVEEEDDEFEIYRKRMMLAYRFRPNPLVREQLLFQLHVKKNVLWCNFVLPFRISDRFSINICAQLDKICFLCSIICISFLCTTNLLPLLEQSSSTILLKQIKKKKSFRDFFVYYYTYFFLFAFLLPGSTILNKYFSFLIII